MKLLHIITIAWACIHAGNVLAVMEVGENDFRISFQHNEGDFNARDVALAYNGQTNEYLVVWIGGIDSSVLCGGASNRNLDIHARRINADTGEFVGNVFLVSFTCLTTGTALTPDVVYNSTENEYLVVWAWDAGTDQLDQEFEIFAQRISASGALLGAPQRVSDVSGIGDADYSAKDPAVSWGAIDNEYLVVWSGDDNENGGVDNEFEIYGQKLDADITEIGANDFNISTMGGGPGSNLYQAFDPDVEWATNFGNQFLIVWSGSHNVGGLVPHEFEIFSAQYYNNTVVKRNTRISSMGGTGDSLYDAGDAKIAWNPSVEEYLVVWHGDDNSGSLVEGETEIFAHQVDPALGTPNAGGDLRVSNAGVDGDDSVDAQTPQVTWNNTDKEYLVVWVANGPKAGVSGTDLEVFAQRLDSHRDENQFPVVEEIGSNDTLISDMGGLGGMGDGIFTAERPEIAWNMSNNSYLVVWDSDDNAGGLSHNDREIFGQQLVKAKGIIFSDTFESD